MDIILHPDELFLKGNNQPFFYNKLKRNLESLFAPAKTRRIEGGMALQHAAEGALSRLALIPGIANFAPAIRCVNETEEIKSGISSLISNIKYQISNFRITAERSFKQYPKSSMQIEKEIGEYVRQKTSWKVNLNNPDLTIHISVGKNEAWIYGNNVEGVGGLPVGATGKVMCLVSGGIDSPVAAYEMMKRGAEVVLIHFQNKTQVTDEVSEKILNLAKVLAMYQGEVHLLIYPFAKLQRQIIMKVPADLRMLAVRRLMFQIAERQAREHECLALATGDSLGQVASQTLENINVIYADCESVGNRPASASLRRDKHACSLQGRNIHNPIAKLTPLIARNKREIVDIARKIGTLGISNRPYEDCCSLFLAKHPQTRASLEQVLKYESELDLSTIDKEEIKSYYISCK